MIVRSQVAPWLFQRTARPAVELMPVETDTGVVQIDSLHLDARATIERARDFMASFDARVAAEVDFLRAQEVTMVIADLPPLGIAAAHAAGLPAIAYGNFTWDWIYANYDGGADLARRIGEIYSHTTLALRLPMWGGFETMPRRSRHSVCGATLASRSRRHPTRTRDSAQRAGRAGVVRRLRIAWRHQAERSRPTMCCGPAMWMKPRCTTPDTATKISSARSTWWSRKPGYGIISECIANDTALLYTSRGDFREYPVLVEAMPKYPAVRVHRAR